MFLLLLFCYSWNVSFLIRVQNSHITLKTTKDYKSPIKSEGGHFPSQKVVEMSSGSMRPEASFLVLSGR